jgi:hypothetical protein
MLTDFQVIGTPEYEHVVGIYRVSIRCHILQDCFWT